MRIPDRASFVSAPIHDVVASTGTGKAGRADGRRLATALTDRGFAVCRAWVRSCLLEGHDNVQGQEAANEDVPFLHVQFTRSVRTSGERLTRAAAARNTITARRAKSACVVGPGHCAYNLLITERSVQWSSNSANTNTTDSKVM
ncbi:hypothetical protein AB5J56_00940 [Streptomyces sp. R21]|uniref:BRCT domain-containing protein n=1 Tax=Streptomyces sp. R21 TaxID=3238627 RepID=A0AB39NYR8_9ACTN